MLDSLTVRNFTVFADTTFQFGKQLNVIHGVNGLGKTHVLKLAYLLQHAIVSPPVTARGSAPTKAILGRLLAEELIEVFRPDGLGRLATRSQGRTSAFVDARFTQPKARLSFAFHSASRTEVKVDHLPAAWQDEPPVYLPTREVLSIYPGFVSLYDSREIEFDRTWRDVCALLGRAVTRGAKAEPTRELLTLIEEVMGARVELDRTGRFYLVVEEHAKARLEMHLVAEGIRKLAMVARLIATGALAVGGCLFWDEPEANLNPVLIQKVAQLLCLLATQGVQVFVATHSLFLMRELHILQQTQFSTLDTRYFGLHPDGNLPGNAKVLQGSRIEDTGTIAALDQDLLQADRYINVATGVVNTEEAAS